ncbi:MAG: putative gamma-glutamyltransferase YwrD [Alphaproteobacteria bacterium MarineAlpha5_Bin8]|nr:MAG: putative gamma-glutamyltransferase YwrD [Alphaproteobacteria bacterium MarineAlpha5_Bin7]PPR47881.1 MAG: putative gamma-glutamyltransferase YwrD [Alphaproteobacteria bacterium MarineAlpha5_Bin8]PPR52892.1 MAG: putative gamma-glutamyltransferase YwrD [Alphaproteobacteria bacterium MarineAlpha5_Bin6]|tara:strand:- start:287 stop:1873 length:1587 start_codon:yes stop_codon:yes gene_type:complete
MRNRHFPGRSNVLATNGIAATSQPLSSLEAISILKKGGNAVDAAIAASAVQSVIEPNSTGLGGDCFALVNFNNKKPIAINGSGIMPQKTDLSFFIKNKINNISVDSPHSVTIPGAVHAWCSMHEKYGKLNFEELFITAENYARNGYPVHEIVSYSWEKNIKKIISNKNTKKIFSKNGIPYKFGEIHRNISLADTISSVAKNGIKDFYTGYIAEDIVKSMKELGGNHCLEDFKNQNTLFTNTIFNEYKSNILHQCPPNSPGITVLIMMAILERFNINEIDPLSADRFHLQAEATKLAYEIKESLIGDPNFDNFNFKDLLKREFITNLVKKISMKKIYKPKKISVTAHPETIYLTVVDKDLNAVSLINSICFAFGSGITTNKTGILLHNRGVNFRVEKQHPNSVEGNKRPLHTIIPGIVTNKSKEVILSYGVMGGQYQPVGQSHILQNIFDYNMDIQEALDCPRAFYLNEKYLLEKSIPLKVLKELQKKGHNAIYSEDTHGGGQAIFIDRERGVMIAGSDPRKDGCAIGY